MGACWYRCVKKRGQDETTFIRTKSWCCLVKNSRQDEAGPSLWNPNGSASIEEALLRRVIDCNDSDDFEYQDQEMIREHLYIEENELKACHLSSTRGLSFGLVNAAFHNAHVITGDSERDLC